MSVKCYYLSCCSEDGSMPLYYKVIGTYREMDDYCSELWSIGEDPEIDRERDATEEELSAYAIRDDKDYPLVYESIRHFD